MFSFVETFEVVKHCLLGLELREVFFTSYTWWTCASQGLPSELHGTVQYNNRFYFDESTTAADCT